jgi:hypothetical protein
VLNTLIYLFQRLFLGATKRVITLDSGIQAHFVLRKDRSVSRVVLYRDVKIFKKLNWADTSESQDFLIPSQQWHLLVDFARARHSCGNLGSFRYDEISDRVIFNNDGEIFSITLSDVLKINELGSGHVLAS